MQHCASLIHGGIRTIAVLCERPRRAACGRRTTGPRDATHTLLTVREALREGISVEGVAINCAREAAHDRAEQTNVAVIGELSPVPILGVIPHLQGVCKEALDEAASCLDRERIMRR